MKIDMRNAPILLGCFSLMISGLGCLGDKGLGDDTGTTMGSSSDGAHTDSGIGETTTEGETTNPTRGETIGSTGGGETDGSGTDGTGDTGDTGGQRCETDPLPTLGPTLDISVELINDTEQTFYFAGRTEGCTPFGIRRNGVWRPLAVGYQCGCECPPPRDTQVETIAIAPGESHTMSWDGRVLAVYSKHTLCIEEPFPSLCIGEQDGSAQPMEPGLVQLVVPVFGPEPPEGDRPSTLLDMCPGHSSFAVQLDLNGEDLSVDVLLSTVDPG